LHLAVGDADVIAVGSAEPFDEDLALIAPRRPDAAAAIILAGERYVRTAGLRPLARFEALSFDETGARILRAEGSDNADALALVDACRSLDDDIIIAAGGTARAAVRLGRCDA
jgi:hypothetical protein